MKPTQSRELPSTTHRTSDRFIVEKKALGARLRALRKTREWTLEKAAEHTGLDWRHIQMIEAGQPNVTLLTIVRLAEGFGVPVSEFFSDGPQQETARPAALSASPPHP